MSDLPASGGNLARALDALEGVRVLVAGDLMLDHYLSGDAERISPEAPVPVVRVREERHLLGGAGNVARNIAALGGSPVLVGAVGDDDPGRAVSALLEREGIAGHLVVDRKRQTTIKTRIIARNQQMLRVDREQSGPLTGKALDALVDLIALHAPGCAAVIVSDYGKGVVCKAVMDAVRNVPGNPVVLVDPKVVNAALYAGADLLTPNAKEAGEMAGVSASGREGVLRAGHALYKKLRCSGLCITLGPEGMAVFEKPGRVFHVPTVARSVFDVTGAGDTVISVLALALGAGVDLLTACVLANYAAGIVVGQVGTAAATRPDVLEAMGRLPAPEVETWLDIE